MTTRFSISELSQMLHVPVDTVRNAVDNLANEGELTAESFIYNERNWRIAPSDVKRIQEWIRVGVTSGEITLQVPKRVIKRKLVDKEAE